MVRSEYYIIVDTMAAGLEKLPRMAQHYATGLINKGSIIEIIYCKIFDSFPEHKTVWILTSHGKVNTIPAVLLENFKLKKITGHQAKRIVMISKL